MMQNTEVEQPQSVNGTEADFQPLVLGQLKVWPPVVLAPMAGITNAPFRAICRRFGAGLYVSEMITARSFVENNPYTLKLTEFAPGESPRSIQLYGIDPYHMAEATKRLRDQLQVDHIDMNFGCPVRKVTRKGGGAAIPLKPNLLRNLVRAVVKNAGDIPVTIKVRMGISHDLLTYLSSGEIAEEEGCAAISLHARTAAELYSGRAHWEAIAALRDHLKSIKVLGNGDIWRASDGIRLMRETGCDGIVIGRGCLGRPWIFRDLASLFNSQPVEPAPNLGMTAKTMLEHATLLCEFWGEQRGMLTFRKHAAWYIKGYPSEKSVRPLLLHLKEIEQLRKITEDWDLEEPLSENSLSEVRGKSTGMQKVALPHGYLDNLADDSPPCLAAEDPASGG